MQVKTLRAGMRCSVLIAMMVYRSKTVIVIFKKRSSVAKYNTQQQKPKENSEIQKHRSLSEDAKQVQSCPIFDVNVPNQGFDTLNTSSDQPSDTVYWNSGTTPGFQPRAMPDNFP